jgi:signal transduction histidine kinase/CheY-like chemotaxis protein
MLDFFSHLLSADPFMPHGMCFMWDPLVLWLHVISDTLIAAAYYALPVLLFYFSRRRRDIPFNWIFVAFGMFILACGATHLLAAVTVWHPVYRLDGVVKAVTAVASIATALMLVPLMPTLISLPSPSQLKRVNTTLALEIEERRTAEAEVRHINEELEQRVASRTADYKQAADSLQQALHDLRAEMNRREDLEHQLIQSQKMEAVGRLAGGVAHDFNNLLTVILGYNEMLRAQVKADPLAQEYAQEVLQAAERAAALTNQLLAFSRRQMTVPRIVDLNELVRRIDKMLGRIIGEDIRLVMRLDLALPLVKVDPSHIDQVIMNLAVNSRDAMPEGGEISIETSCVQLTEEYLASHIDLRPGAYALLTVSDTGIGMDATTRTRIFEPFFTTKEKGKGTGLGLSIVYGIVKQNGGEILVYSEPGQGTVFKIYIPAAPDAVPAPLAATPEAAIEPARGTILLVEDEEQVRNLVRAMLVREGYRVLDYASATEALQTVRERSESIDLLLTDMVMPQMSGLDLAREVRGARPRIQVLFMSGYTDASVTGQGLITADTPFLQKPFTAAALRTKVRELLG